MRGLEIAGHVEIVVHFDFLDGRNIIRSGIAGNIDVTEAGEGEFRNINFFLRALADVGVEVARTVHGSAVSVGVLVEENVAVFRNVGRVAERFRTVQGFAIADEDLFTGFGVPKNQLYAAGGVQTEIVAGRAVSQRENALGRHFVVDADRIIMLLR